MGARELAYLMVDVLPAVTVLCFLAGVLVGLFLARRILFS